VIEYWNQADTGCVVANFMMGMFSQFILPLYLFCLYSLLLLYKSLTTKKLMHIKKMEKGLERIPIPKSASTFT